MPEPARSELFQTAVLWTFLGMVDGEPLLAAPVELMYPNGCRFNTSRRDSKDSKGQKITLDGTALVNQRIEIDSLFWLGTLEEWYGTGSGTTLVPDTEVYQVVEYKEVPDLKERETSGSIGLMRWRGLPPP